MRLKTRIPALALAAIFCATGAMADNAIPPCDGASPVAAESAQQPSGRRKRPGSMRHSEADVQNARRVTRLKGTHIHDNTTFNGDVYMTGDAGAIKIGSARIVFRNGGYTLSYEAGEFDMRTSSTHSDRVREGITEYEYNNSWRPEKLGSDFAHAGKYEIAEQYGKVHLILYDGNTDKVFASIPLASANDSSFEFQEEDFLIQFAPAK